MSLSQNPNNQHILPLLSSFLHRQPYHQIPTNLFIHSSINSIIVANSSSSVTLITSITINIFVSLQLSIHNDLKIFPRLYFAISSSAVITVSFTLTFRPFLSHYFTLIFTLRYFFIHQNLCLFLVLILFLFPNLFL